MGGVMSTRYARIGLVFWVAMPFVAGWIGSRFVPGPWYAELVKPSWTPPDAVFGPVWSLLYLLMGIAAWLVWREAGFAAARVALGLFVFQLVLNALWSYLFFGLHRPDLALVDIVLLWLAIVATMIAFWKIRPLAAWLLAPYWAWVSFAAVLNGQLWRLNS